MRIDMETAIRHFVPQARLPRVRLVEAGLGLIDGSWWSNDVVDAFFRVYANDRVGAEVVMDGRVDPITPGWLHVIPAWSRFDCRCHAPTAHRYLHFEVVGLAAGPSRRWIPRPMRFEPPEWASAAWDDDGTARDMRLASVAWWTLAAITDRCGEPPIRAAAVQNRFGPALDLIERRLHDRLAVRDLAEVCGLSTGQFSRRFSDMLGVSPGEFLIERRVTRAAELLTDTEFSLEQIAERCGFSDRFHMTKVFGKRMGVPPAAYRGTQKRLR